MQVLKKWNFNSITRVCWNCYSKIQIYEWDLTIYVTKYGYDIYGNHISVLKLHEFTCAVCQKKNMITDLNLPNQFYYNFQEKYPDKFLIVNWTELPNICISLKEE